MIRLQSSYQYALLDCDGVILNTNSQKKQAFLDIAKGYFLEVPTEFASYLSQSPGLSRFDKLAKLIEIACPGIDASESDKILQNLINKYSVICLDIMREAEVNWDLIDYCRGVFARENLGVVSNSEQAELRAVFKERSLTSTFGLGIFGSPVSKKDNLKKIMNSIGSVESAIYVGDTQNDRECCEKLGIPFALYSPWDVEG